VKHTKSRDVLEDIIKKAITDQDEYMLTTISDLHHEVLEYYTLGRIIAVWNGETTNLEFLCEYLYPFTINSILLFAIKKNNIVLAKEALELGASPYAIINGVTPLVLSMEVGNADMIELIVERIIHEDSRMQAELLDYLETLENSEYYDFMSNVITTLHNFNNEDFTLNLHEMLFNL
jgi:ankyrin repeat protein